MFTIYPAIDLKNGQVVRLHQGRADESTVYGNDPAAAARRWVEQGAHCLHVVDLDAALPVSRAIGNQCAPFLRR